MTIKGAEFGVAILDPPSTERHKKIVPSVEVRARLRSAAWNGLKIVWCNGEQIAHEDWQFPAAERAQEFEEIRSGLRDAICRAANPSWASASKSRAAEQFVRPVIHDYLEVHGFGVASGVFESFWREGRTDGAWARTGHNINSVALEVKVNEDIDAPWGQIIDDLGSYDVVIQIRFITNEKTRRRVLKVSSMGSSRLADALPIVVLELCFCAICRHAIPFDGMSYPHVVCHACDERALNTDGNQPETNSMYDTGQNPVWIDGKKCWRRYRFGGWMTMQDPDDCATLKAFYAKHFPRPRS